MTNDDDNNEDDKDSNNSNNNDEAATLSYDDTDVGSKGLVGGLTAIINSFNPSSSPSSLSSVSSSSSTDSTTNSSSSAQLQPPPPTSSKELLDRIRQDYVDNNYLWTGQLDINCFRKDCQFTDPTISFVGTDAFVENTQNLVPIINALVTLKEPSSISSPSQPTNYSSYDKDDDNDSKLSSSAKVGESILLSIQDYPQKGYIQTRWRMVGTLDKNPWLFWKPTIDVVGRTKFWYGNSNINISNDDSSSSDNYYQVWFYDEEWEIPAYRALLQLITPSGTISNSQG